jgi:hypothetical protein
MGMVKVPLFKDVFGAEGGEAVVDGENIRVRFGTTNINVPLSYVSELSIVDRTHLGKIKTRLVIYDFLGNKNVIDALMSEANFHTLKGLCRK